MGTAGALQARRVWFFRALASWLVTVAVVVAPSVFPVTGMFASDEPVNFSV